MGKPYHSELLRLTRTFRESLALDVGLLAERLSTLSEFPLISVGSGGSQTTAHLLAELHQLRFGQLAKAETPLLVRNYLQTSRPIGVVLVSAGGRNPDILGIARAAVEAEPRSLIALCASRNSPLSRIVNAFNRGFSFEFELSSGNDGFLATNSLLALSTAALRAYGFLSHEHRRSLATLFTPSGLEKAYSLSRIGQSFLNCRYLVVLYGPGSRTAAYDLESKLIEAGLVSVQLSDYRNFAHGRHHWIAKNSMTAVVALAARDETQLASRTLVLLPATVPKLLLGTNHCAPLSSLALQAAVFGLVAEYGKARKIDPGRPGVPPFGRRVYHYNAFAKQRETIETVAIRRKRNAGHPTDSLAFDTLSREFALVTQRIRKAEFHGIVLDYDGTICDLGDRFGDIPDKTATALRRITHAGFLLGVATGRGKSVGKALRDAFPRNHWKHIWVGYYNGGAIARLDDDTKPDTAGIVSPELQSAVEALGAPPNLKLHLSIRPQQLTVENDITSDIHELWRHVFQRLMESRAEGLKVVASTRSVDVIPMMTSKLNLLAAMRTVRPDSTFLCIGDRPRWPGNDAELLKHPFSLSVDEVEFGSASAWNLAPAGVLGSAALRYYLKHIVLRATYFEIRVPS
jgi:hydroxymethylpyrimidine pyrophosphatase-like HAD family hydrolase/fructoselysine-6-P-deglycase FrlB-like protein